MNRTLAAAVRSRARGRCEYCRFPESEVDQFDVGTEPFGGGGPTVPERSRSENQDTVTGCEQVGDRSLPNRVTVANEDGDMAVGTGHPFEVGDHRVSQGDQFTFVDVWGTTMHRLQDPVGDDRGARRREHVATVGQTHFQHASGGRGAGRQSSRMTTVSS